MNIFEISQELLRLFDQIEEQDGEITPDIEQELFVREEELEHKLKSFAWKISLIKGEIQVIKDEIDRLNKIKESKIKLEERLREIVKNTVIMFGETGKTGNKKIKYDTLNLYTVNKDKVDLDEEQFYIPEYMNYTIKVDNTVFAEIADKLPAESVSWNINKTKIGNALKEGLDVPGANLIENPYIVIK